ncbi:MAG: heavy metal-binding domain-containing protein [Gammaproteobacteria bacterium]|nr:heavy metal-binding domain-containing protein [Gammaproteobacteria bacterium]
MLNLLIPIILLVLGYLIGTLLEKRHFESLRDREKKLLDTPVVTFDELDPATNPDFAYFQRTEFAQGSVVVSVDYFKQFLAGLRNIFGGRVSSYETLIDRARREAVLRLKESVPGANGIANMRIETATLSGSGLGAVEVYAYGTALYESALTCATDSGQTM